MNHLPTTRHSLLLRLADAEDDAAWGEFLEVYERAIFHFACSRGLQPVDAEDVTQRVLSAVMEKARKWQPDPAKGSFGAWLFRVARNLSAKAWNATVRDPLEVGDSKNDLALLEAQEPSSEDSTLFHLEYRRALFHWAAERVRDQVQESTWQAFWKTAVDERGAKQVGQELGMTVSSVYTAKCRVLDRIRHEIDSFEDEFSIHNDGN